MPVFIITYITALVVVGFPLLLLESYIGQFTSHGILTCWEMFPLLKSVGVATLFLCFISSVNMSVINAWAVNYLFLSMKSTPPWTTCDNHWNTAMCKDNDTITMDVDHYSNHTIDYYYHYDYSVPVEYSDPAEEFFYREFIKLSDGINTIGSLVWPISVASVSTWVIIALALVFGPRVYGKVAYVTLTLPAILLFVLLIRAVTLPGSAEGLKFLFYPHFEVMLDIDTWSDVCGLALLSAGVGLGPIITLTSYSKFRNDCVRDTFLVPVIYLVFSILAAVFVMSTVGFIAHVKGVAVTHMVISGHTLLFQMLPLAFSSMPSGAVWSVLFYLMIMVLVVGSLIPMTDTIVTAVLDLVPSLHRLSRRFIVVLPVCTVCSLLSLLLTTNGGFYIFLWIDHFSYLQFILIILCELLGVACMYGIFSYSLTNATLLRFKDDLSLILGGRGCHCVPWVICWPVWSLMWCFITPTVMLLYLYYQCGKFHHLMDLVIAMGSNLYVYPMTTKAIGVLFSLLPLFFMCVVPVVLVLMVCCCYSRPLSDSLEYLIKPSRYWGPSQPRYRARMNKYLRPEQFEIDPWNKSTDWDYRKTTNI